MAKIYGALEVAQLEWFTDTGKPAASSYIYRVIYVSDLKQVMVSDGSNWIPFLNTSTNQTVNGNITFAGEQIFNGLHRLSVTTDSSSTGAVTALNNVTPVIEFTGAVTSISGIVNSASGATVMLVNRTGGTIAVLDEDTGATAANRIRTGTGAQITLANNASIILTYVGDNRWHIIGGSGSGAGAGGVNFITNGTAEADTQGWAVYAESDAVTFQDTGDTVTLNSHGLSNGNQISFTSIVSTTGISTNTLYFVINATTNTFQVATTATGSALPLTTNGSGTMVRFAPKVGTGGTSNLTITRTTTTPLVGTASFLLAKDAANRQGQGWSYDFSIDLAYRAKVLQISFDYLVNSGTFSAGATGSNSDVTVWIYDVTNAVLIQPSNIKLFSNNASITDKFQASFQTASNSSNYRLIVHVTSTSASAYTLEVDSVSVAPSEYVFGTPVTDWQSYTPTFTGFGTATNINFKSRRVGDSLQVIGYFQAGTCTAVQAQITLGYAGGNGNVTVDTNKVASLAVIGSGASNTGAASSYFGNLTVLANGAVNYVNFGVQTSTLAALTATTATNIIANNSYISFYCEVPIAGWSSSVQTSDSVDTRVVDFVGFKNSTQSVTASVTDITFTSQKDSHAAWNGSQYVVPVAGDYLLSLTIKDNSGTQQASIFVDGSAYRAAFMTAVSGFPMSGSIIVYGLKTGQTLSVRSATGGTVGVDGVLSIQRLSGPSAIAASESVNAQYFNTAGTVFTAGTITIVPYATKIFDTHSAWATNTYTCPTSGKYQVNASIWGSGTNADPALLVYKNGTIYGFLGSSITFNGSHKINGMQFIPCNAGDTISVYLQASGSGGNVTLITNSGYNHIDIQRIGN